MKLLNGVIRPGVVVDTLYGGCIKATAPGLFSVTDNTDNLPPIMPWFIGQNSGAFSQPNLYDEVWILNFSDNPQQLYWFKKENMDNVVNNIPEIGKNVEVLCNKEVGGEWCGIYFTDGTGWVISKGESKIIMAPNGDITLYNPQPNRCIDITSKSISLGSLTTSAHPVAFGDVIQNILTLLCTMLNGIAMKAMANPHTAAIGTDLLKKLPEIVNQISDISSTNVTVD